MTTPPDQDPSNDRDAPQELDDLGGFVEDDKTSNFLESRWWRWLGIAFAVLIGAAFTLPLLTPFFRGGGEPAPPQPPARSAALPDFVLQAADGTTVRLSDETRRNDAVVLVFYRGYF